MAGAPAAALPLAPADRLQPIPISEHFPVPPALVPAIGFWRSIFGKFETHEVVFHDREHLGIRWRVAAVPRNGAGEVDPRQRDRVMQAGLDDLRRRLRRLARTKKPQDDADTALIEAAGGPQAPVLQGAHRRVRAQRGVADNFRAGRERSRPLFAEIQQILREEGVPAEVAVLPFVESNFNPQARSSAGAMGLWQLMPATARGLGLKVTRRRDERRDVRKATRAAARMLRQNFEMLGTWPLAITGYNHGPYGVRRAVRQVGSTDLMVLIENYQKSTWGFASKNFYAEFLAILELLRQDDDLGPLVMGALHPPPAPGPTPATQGP